MFYIDALCLRVSVLKNGRKIIRDKIVNSMKMFRESSEKIEKHAFWRQKTSFFTLKTIERNYDANV